VCQTTRAAGSQQQYQQQQQQQPPHKYGQISIISKVSEHHHITHEPKNRINRNPLQSRSKSKSTKQIECRHTISPITTQEEEEEQLWID